MLHCKVGNADCSDFFLGKLGHSCNICQRTVNKGEILPHCMKFDKSTFPSVSQRDFVIQISLFVIVGLAREQLGAVEGNWPVNQVELLTSISTRA